MSDKKYFPFYYNWAEMINDSYDDDDKEYAQLLAFAIVRYASTGEIIDLGDRRAQRMFERALLQQESTGLAEKWKELFVQTQD